MLGFAPFAAVAFSALAQAQASTEVAVGAPFAFAPFSAVAFSSLPDPVLSLSASTGTFTLTGSATGVEIRRASSTGSFALTGNAATLISARTLVGDVGSFTLTGQSAAQTQQRASASGTFALTGNDATIARFVVFDANGGTFALTGRAATFGLGRRITAARGTFSLTGQNATLLRAKILIAAKGTFLLSGNAAPLNLILGQLGRNAVGSLTGPVNAQGQIDANIVRANDNIVAQAFNSHDANASIHVQSGTLALRPTTTTDGATYFCTDTRDTYSYVSNAWVQSGWAHWYGSFSDTTDQTTSAANTATKVTFNTTDMAQGFSLVSTSRMTAAYAGTYNFQWSGQFTSSSSSEEDIDVWVRINGTNVVGSTGRVTIPKKHGSTDGHVLPGWNYYLTLAANDYVELYWAASSTAVSLQFSAASAWAPSTASIIATLTRV